MRWSRKRHSTVGTISVAFGSQFSLFFFTRNANIRKYTRLVLSTLYAHPYHVAGFELHHFSGDVQSHYIENINSAKRNKRDWKKKKKEQPKKKRPSQRKIRR